MKALSTHLILLSFKILLVTVKEGISVRPECYCKSYPLFLVVLVHFMLFYEYEVSYKKLNREMHDLWVRHFINANSEWQETASSDKHLRYWKCHLSISVKIAYTEQGWIDWYGFESDKQERCLMLDCHKYRLILIIVFITSNFWR